MLCLWSDPPGFNCWISFTWVLSCILLSPYLCFTPSLYIDLYLLGNDTSISKGSFMRSNHLIVLIHIRNKGEVGTMKLI